jgi:hypothetical protein
MCVLYIHTVRHYTQYSTIAIPHTSQFTVAHALGFSVFTSRILATGLSQSHCHFKSHMKYSFHSLIPFLPLSCSCQFIRLGPIRLFSTTVLYTLCSLLSNPSYNNFARTPRETLSMNVLFSHAYASRECVYRVVACHWIYTSQYVRILFGVHLSSIRTHDISTGIWIL